MRKFIYKEKSFLKPVLILAIPIIFQNLITSSLNLVDNLMIGSLGENQIAAVGLANQFYFLFILAMNGINGGASIFMSQFYGKKDIKNIKKFLGIDLTVGFITSLTFAILAIIFPQFIMSIFTKDLNVITLGSNYLRVVSISYILTNLTLSFSTALRSTNQTKIPMYGSIIGLICNGFLNWVFIFGNLGSPSLGVVGAALATTLARTFEMLFIILSVYLTKNKIRCTFKEITFNKSLLKKYSITASPVIFNDIMWSLGITCYTIAYGKIGVSAVATIQIANTVNNLFNIFGIGMASATSILIGNKIGAKTNDEAVVYAKKIGLYTPILGLIIGIILFIFSPMIISLFNINAETYNNTLWILRIMALLTPLRFFNIVMIIGVLRGGGDVNYAIFSELIAVWAYAVPIAFISTIFFNLSVIVVYILVCGEEVVKFFFEIPRFNSNKWVKDITSNI